MHIKYRFYQSLYVLITLFFGDYQIADDVYANNQVVVSLQQCPDVLYVGEKGHIAYRFTNTGSNTLEVSRISFGTNGITNPENSSQFNIHSNHNYPMNVQPGYSFLVEGSFSSDEELYHYVEPLLYYSTRDNGSSTENLIRGEQCGLRVVSTGYDKNDSTTPLGSAWDFFTSSPISVLLLAPIGGVVAYYLQRSFTRRESELQQNIQHRNLLLDRAHSVASKYYPQLSKLAEEAHTSIRFAMVSDDINSIKKAYYFVSLFLVKYLEFERETGASYIFVLDEREKEFLEEKVLSAAVGAAQGIMLSLPFDRSDIVTIVNNTDSDEAAFKQPDFEDIYFYYFTQWLRSNYCNRTRKTLLHHFDDLSRLLNWEGAKIIEPNYFMSNFGRKIVERRPETIQKIIDRDSSAFIWISHHTPKYLSPGENVVIYGKGFSDQEHVENYWFKIGHETIDRNQKYIRIEKEEKGGGHKEHGEYLRVPIPLGINAGTYDLFAIYKIKGENKERETAGITVHISN